MRMREINSIEESGQVLSVGAIQVQIGHGPCSPLCGSTWIFLGSRNIHPEIKIPEGCYEKDEDLRFKGNPMGSHGFSFLN